MVLQKFVVPTNSKEKYPIIEKAKNLLINSWFTATGDKIVNDLHWKTASSMCKISDKILIGNMSTIGILQGNLTSSTKRLV